MVSHFPPPAHRHGVQFYENEAFLAAAVADFLAQGLQAGEPVVVIATAAHREAFALRLRSKGLDVERACAEGRCVFVEARECLAEFMANSGPDPERFAATLRRIFGGVLQGGRTPPMRAYGEMVDLLWMDGDTEAALRLEELWNGAAQVHDFSLLCAYSMGNFVGTGQTAGFEAVCREHTHVVPTERYLEADDEVRLVEIALLQQRARSLEAEVEHRRELEQRLREALGSLRRTEQLLRASLGEQERLLAGERAARAEAEQARLAAEGANRAKSDFLAVMSHEFRTPLNAITGYSDLLELDVHGTLSDGQREFVQRIKRSSRHLLGLVSDVLNYARVEAGKADYAITDVAMDDALRAAEALVLPQMQARRITFRYDGCDGSVVARADPERLRQILLNLLSNATKFTDRAGEVRVKCVTDEAKVVVHVQDTGIGIAPEKLEAIFEPFVQIDAGLTREHEGAGLGLAISRDLARGMGGDLTASSEVGKGSTFTLTLSAAQPGERLA